LKQHALDAFPQHMHDARLLPSICTAAPWFNT